MRRPPPSESWFTAAAEKARNALVGGHVVSFPAASGARATRSLCLPRRDRRGPPRIGMVPVGDVRRPDAGCAGDNAPTRPWFAQCQRRLPDPIHRGLGQREIGSLRSPGPVDLPWPGISRPSRRPATDLPRVARKSRQPVSLRSPDVRLARENWPLAAKRVTLVASSSLSKKPRSRPLSLVGRERLRQNVSGFAVLSERAFAQPSPVAKMLARSQRKVPRRPAPDRLRSTRAMFFSLHRA